MKKIIAMLLVLVMSVTGLVGCGSSKDNEAGSTNLLVLIQRWLRQLQRSLALM